MEKKKYQSLFSPSIFYRCGEDAQCHRIRPKKKLISHVPFDQGVYYKVQNNEFPLPLYREKKKCEAKCPVKRMPWMDFVEKGILPVERYLDPKNVIKLAMTQRAGHKATLAAKKRSVREEAKRFETIQKKFPELVKQCQNEAICVSEKCLAVCASVSDGKPFVRLLEFLHNADVKVTWRDAPAKTHLKQFNATVKTMDVFIHHLDSKLITQFRNMDEYQVNVPHEDVYGESALRSIFSYEPLISVNGEWEQHLLLALQFPSLITLQFGLELDDALSPFILEDEEWDEETEEERDKREDARVKYIDSFHGAFDVQFTRGNDHFAWEAHIPEGMVQDFEEQFHAGVGHEDDSEVYIAFGTTFPMFPNAVAQPEPQGVLSVGTPAATSPKGMQSHGMNEARVPLSFSTRSKLLRKRLRSDAPHSSQEREKLLSELRKIQAEKSTS